MLTLTEEKEKLNLTCTRKSVLVASLKEENHSARKDAEWWERILNSSVNKDSKSKSPHNGKRGSSRWKFSAIKGFHKREAPLDYGRGGQLF